MRILGCPRVSLNQYTSYKEQQTLISKEDVGSTITDQRRSPPMLTYSIAGRDSMRFNDSSQKPIHPSSRSHLFRLELNKSSLVQKHSLASADPLRTNQVDTIHPPLLNGNSKLTRLASHIFQLRTRSQSSIYFVYGPLAHEWRLLPVMSPALCYGWKGEKVVLVVTRVVPLISSKEGGTVVKKGGFFNMFNNEPIRLGFRSFGEIHLALSVEPTLRGAT